MFGTVQIEVILNTRIGWRPLPRNVFTTFVVNGREQGPMTLTAMNSFLMNSYF